MKTHTLLKASLALNALFVLGIIGFLAGAACLLLAPASEQPPRLSEIAAPTPARNFSPSLQLPPSREQSHPAYLPASGSQSPNPPAPANPTGFFGQLPSVPPNERPTRPEEPVTTASEPTPDPNLPSAAALQKELPGAADPVPQDPRQAGNSFRAGTMRVAVAGSYATVEGPALAMDFTPITPPSLNPGNSSQAAAVPQATPSRGTESTQPFRENSSTSRPQSSTPDINTLGKPTEEELFRMKWGWDAYDQAQREALKEAGQRRTTPAP